MPEIRGCSPGLQFKEQWRNSNKCNDELHCQIPVRSPKVRHKVSTVRCSLPPAVSGSLLSAARAVFVFNGALSCEKAVSGRDERVVVIYRVTPPHNTKIGSLPVRRGN